MTEPPARRRDATDFLALPDEDLLDQCWQDTYRSSGPGGQHRNKVSSAVRLRHGPTGLTVHADESRSQHENRTKAVARLRMAIACRVRRPADPVAPVVPEAVASCLFVPKGGRPGAPRRLEVGRKDRRFWTVAQFLLDLLEAGGGRLAPAAAALGITTSNLAGVLKQDRHLHAAAGELRKRHGHGPLK